ncbi:type II secretion system protein [Pseudoalteromonas sp. G4]|uniref:type II secretion system protein n=1 Tax=Pseudoalteromonas sp. G4 TaxID=2992761 RepID=UPI00237DC81A|nr:type II secretion system protein [Pseudoalteromonas sp. G4]MDE3273219.1 type II secretion system GspH family protein [Pseudoalteromonas sp. G4]
MPANKLKGFTLVEVIFGIVLMAIVLTIVTGLLVPQARQSADPVIQVKANELGQAMMNEILGRSFDENSRRSPPFIRCGEVGFSSCTAPSSLGNDGETRDGFNDVDDFIGNYATADLKNSLGQSIQTDYPGFTLTVSVVYDDDANGVADTSGEFNKLKLITIEVVAPTGDIYGFSAYKGNY